MMNKKYLSVKDASEIYSLSRTTLYYLRKNNLIKWFTVNIPPHKSYSAERNKPRPTKILILKDSLDEYIEKYASK